MSEMLSGSCSCGAVTYQASSPVRRIVNCHCNMCRRMNGSMFSSYAVIKFENLKVQGGEHLGRYHPTERAIKHFCRNCGSPVFNLNAKYPGACMLYLGSLREGIPAGEAIHVYFEDKLDWMEQIGSMEKFAQEFQRR